MGHTWGRLEKSLPEFVYFAAEICHRWPLPGVTPGGYSQKYWVGVCGPLPKTLTPIYDQNLLFSLPYL